MYFVMGPSRRHCVSKATMHRLHFVSILKLTFTLFRPMESEKMDVDECYGLSRAIFPDCVRIRLRKGTECRQ